jgi:hypothetical protein
MIIICNNVYPQDEMINEIHTWIGARIAFTPRSPSPSPPPPADTTFSNFPYVCPEPVLANIRFKYKTAQKCALAPPQPTDCTR